MTNILAILRQRRSRRQSARRSAEGRATRATLGVGFVISALLAVALLAAAFAYAELTRDLPALDQIPVYLDPQDGTLLQPTRLYDRSGQVLLAELAPPDAPRRFLSVDADSPDSFSPQLLKTLVATLDPSFWSHAGYTLDDLTDPNAHPTLTQKLVFELLLAEEAPTLRRALRERLLAAQITARYGREQVLAWFLNSANFGRRAYGAEAAAQMYFGKSAQNVTLAEAALLVAALESPALNPIDSPQSAVQRQQAIIQSLSLNNIIDEATAARARAAEVTLRPPARARDLTPSFTGLVLSQLEAQFGRARLERGGLDIITTLDYDLQLQTACAAQTQVARLAGETHNLPAACAAADQLPPLPPGQARQTATAAALILDPATGQVLAFTGEQAAGGVESAWGARPAGTLLTPFIYLTGFTRGLSPASLMWDIPGESGGLPIANPDGRYHGPVRARVALANDYLTPAAQVFAQMGAGNVQRTLQSFGLNLPPDSPPAALITGEAALPPLALARAYAIFAAHGAQYGQPMGETALEPSAVLRVATPDHAALLDWSQPQSAQIVSPQLAYLVNHALKDESARAPSLGSPSPLFIGQAAAAKLGQTPAQTGVWAVGYTPQRLALVWVQSDAPLDPRIAAGLWSGLMRHAARGLPISGWPVPPGVTPMEVCDPSGLMPTIYCPVTALEVFLNGNEPTQFDTLYQPFDINTETGFLATVFTPPQLVERRVFLVAPPAARDWAAAAGIQTPPNAYDTIQPRPPQPEAQITSPGMFGLVYGRLPVIGNARGQDFLYYRLQYGQGLNPQTWFQIGENTARAVDGDTLAEWDTAGLNGLYALRLQVVRFDQTMLTDTIQVIVDNQPPQAEITFPRAGESYPGGAPLPVRVQVADDYALARVTLYLNDRLLTTLDGPDYAFSWHPTPGEHSLRLLVTDSAGNQAEVTVRFTVTR